MGAGVSPAAPDEWGPEMEPKRESAGAKAPSEPSESAKVAGASLAKVPLAPRAPVGGVMMIALPPSGGLALWLRARQRWEVPQASRFVDAVRAALQSAHAEGMARARVILGPKAVSRVGRGPNEPVVLVSEKRGVVRVQAYEPGCAQKQVPARVLSAEELAALKGVWAGPAVAWQPPAAPPEAPSPPKAA